jgi:signal transduction histidine kinase
MYIYILIVLIRDYVLKISLHRSIGIVFILAQFILALVICIWSESFVSQIYLLILIGEFTFHHGTKQSIIFTIVCYISNLAGVLLYRQSSSIIGEIYLLFPRGIDYFAIFQMSVLARIALQRKNQLALDNEKLRMLSTELEQKAKLQERARISRDIHDSIGHTLTSAITGLQTATLALDTNELSLAKDMIHRTKESIRSGLDDVRASVHLLRENVPGEHVKPELIGLIDEVRRQTQIDIECDIDSKLPDLPPMIELTLYRALQEGLTNGIRHGSSTHFQFSLSYQADLIRFRLSDNGNSQSPIVPGFGLNAMQERVEDVDGELAISRNDSTSGVTLEITIPFRVNTLK